MDSSSKNYETLIKISIRGTIKGNLISNIEIYPSKYSEGQSGGACGKWKDSYDPSKNLDFMKFFNLFILWFIVDFNGLWYPNGADQIGNLIFY